MASHRLSLRSSSGIGHRCLRVAAFILITIAVTPLRAAVIYVDRDAPGANDGTSWANAYPALVSALSVATNGDEIWIAQGTHKPNDASDSMTRDQWFQLKSGVSVYGGFAGTETGRVQRDPAAHPTVLSGDLSGDDADLDGDGFSDPVTTTDNCYHVFFHPQELALTDNAVLDGLTIRGGNANGAAPHNGGGGIYNYYCSPQIANCTIVSNSASAVGGGMFNRNTSSPTIVYCTLAGNFATNGGGVCNSRSSPIMSLCVVSDNDASVYGGGIYSYDRSFPTIDHCTVSRNRSRRSGGGIGNNVHSSTALANSTVVSNTASYSGGGIWNMGSSREITNCTIAHNSAPYGGGIAINSVSGPIVNCTIVGNAATFDGGGIENWYSSLTIANCIVWGNTSQIFDALGSPVVLFSIIQGGYSGGSNILTSDPRLLPLGDHGGPTPTMSLSAGSPAIDAGEAGAGIPAADQRGFPRDAKPDIGACEFQGATMVGAVSGGPRAIGSSLAAEVSTEHAGPTYQWYLGHSGDTSRPIAGATGPALLYGPLDVGASVWVRVTPSGVGSPSDSLTRSLEIRGPYEEWCDFHGLAGEERLPAACPAADGLANLLKFALAMDPWVPGDSGGCGRCAYDPVTRTLKQTWTLSKTPTDSSAVSLASDDLVNWFSDGVTGTLLGSDAGTETWEFSLPVTGFGHRFLRLCVQQSP